MSDLDTALDAAKSPATTVPVCLRGDLQADFEDLERRLEIVTKNSPDSLAGNPEARELAEQIEALRGEMESATVPIRVEALARPKWLAMVAKYPVREDNEVDDTFGFATDEMWPELVRASITPHVSDETWAKLDSKLTAGQMEALGLAAAALNRRGKVSIPKSSAASAALRTAAETSS